MKPILAIVETEVDLDAVTRSFLKEHIRYQDGERALQAEEKAHDDAGKKVERRREQQQESRLKMGRLLIEAKRGGGIKHGGWLPYLEKLGVPQQTANAWMREAGYVEAQSKSPSSANDSDMPNLANSRVASGVDRRPRKRDEQPDPPDDPAPPSRARPTDLDAATRKIDRIHDEILAAHRDFDARARRRLIHDLRELLNLIEEE